jgi:hypothetical protein
MAVVVMRC